MYVLSYFIYLINLISSSSLSSSLSLPFVNGDMLSSCCSVVNFMINETLFAFLLMILICLSRHQDKGPENDDYLFCECPLYFIIINNYIIHLSFFLIQKKINRILSVHQKCNIYSSNQIVEMLETQPFGKPIVFLHISNALNIYSRPSFISPPRD